MASRLALAIEYASILWHLRKFKNSHLPFYIQMAIHFIASMIYLGITFRFSEDKQSRVFITWYVVGVMEVVLTCGLSLGFSVLSLVKTHLMNRMSLLTIVILGESIVALAEKVVIVVEGPDAWGKSIRRLSLSSHSLAILTKFLCETRCCYYRNPDWWRGNDLYAVFDLLRLDENSLSPPSAPNRMDGASFPVPSLTGSLHAGIHPIHSVV